VSSWSRPTETPAEVAGPAVDVGDLEIGCDDEVVVDPLERQAGRRRRRAILCGCERGKSEQHHERGTRSHPVTPV
jgi:hypothetical protein